MVVEAKSPRVLLTGATGFIGRRLLERLLSDGYPTAVVLRPSSRLETLGRLADDALVIRHKGMSAELLAAVADFAPDLVVHLAAISRAVHEPRDVRCLLDANVVFGAEIVEAASLAGCRGVVATGTFWEHRGGRPAYQPNSLYAATKRAFADILEYYCQTKDIGVVNLKLTDVYGPNDPRHRLLDQLLDAQETATRIDLSPGEQKLDLIHVDDVVGALVHAADLALKQGAPVASFSIGTGRHLPLREVVSVLEGVTGRKVPVRWGGRPYRANEVMEPWQGPRLPEWEPRICLEDGIRELTSVREGCGD